jgi:hypothetical protein
MITRKVIIYLYLSLLLSCIYFVSMTKVSTKSKNTQRRTAVGNPTHVANALKQRPRTMRRLFSRRISSFTPFRTYSIHLFREDVLMLTTLMYVHVGLFRNDSEIVGSRVISGIRLASQWYYLEIKAWRSPVFDRRCLKATRPDNYSPKEKHIQAIISMTLEVNPKSKFKYFTVLRNIWLRSNYVDRRTGVKSLYLLHRLLRSIPCEHVQEFHQCLSNMQTNQICKETASKYFDKSRLLVRPRGLSPQYQPFLQKYANYVLYRASAFAPFFEDFLVDPSSPSDEAYASKIMQLGQVLRRAEECLGLMLDCSLSTDIESPVSMPCIDLLARDLEDLYPLFECKLADYMISISNLAATNDMNKVLVEEIEYASGMKTKLEQLRANVRTWAEKNSNILSAHGYSPLRLDMDDCSALLGDRQEEEAQPKNLQVR